VVVAIIVVIIAAVGGYYVYASVKGTTSSSSTSTNTSFVHCTSSPTNECAEIGTSYGTMYIELFNASAPRTVANFVYFAQTGFYDNLVWHRIVPNFVIQTGDPNSRNGANRSGWGQGGDPSRQVPLETVASLKNNYSFIGMARSSSPNSGSSQFYVNLKDNPSLDGQYTVFGQVLDGMAVANQIAALPVDSNGAPTGSPLPMMTNVTIINSY